MSISYSNKLGVPKENRITYDKEKRTLTTEYIGGAPEADKCSILYSPHNGLKLLINSSDGEIIGLECFIGAIENLKTAACNLDGYSDGGVFATWDIGNFIAGCTYLIDCPSEPFYDKNDSIVAIGRFGRDNIIVRACDNLFLSVDFGGNLCGVAVKL